MQSPYLPGMYSAQFALSFGSVISAFIMAILSSCFFLRFGLLLRGEHLRLSEKLLAHAHESLVLRFIPSFFPLARDKRKLRFFLCRLDEVSAFPVHAELPDLAPVLRGWRVAPVPAHRALVVRLDRLDLPALNSATGIHRVLFEQEAVICFLEFCFVDLDVVVRLVAANDLKISCHSTKFSFSCFSARFDFTASMSFCHFSLSSYGEFIFGK